MKIPKEITDYLALVNKQFNLNLSIWQDKDDENAYYIGEKGNDDVNKGVIIPPREEFVICEYEEEDKDYNELLKLKVTKTRYKLLSIHYLPGTYFNPPETVDKEEGVFNNMFSAVSKAVYMRIGEILDGIMLNIVEDKLFESTDEEE